MGQDEINWWIVENETNLDELLAITEEALNAAQVLKTDSAKLKNKAPESYKALLVDLKEFAEQHRVEIDALHKYVGLLEKRHPMAPRILFTYRVWGSTRMSDRETNLMEKRPGNGKTKCCERWPKSRSASANVETLFTGTSIMKYGVARRGAGTVGGLSLLSGRLDSWGLG